MVRLRIGHTKETFAIYEELLCSHSSYFREKLQKGRKAIEGECTICHEEMDPTRQELTFCKPGCGGNMHYKCMESWKGLKTARSEAITCPLCRHVWPTETYQQTLQCSDLKADSFDYYQQWLYHHTILLEDREPGTEDSKVAQKEICRLIQAYLLGVQLRDKIFCKDVLKALIDVSNDTNAMPGPNIIGWVYRTMKGESRLRRYLVHIFVIYARPFWFEDGEWGYCPPKFMADLTMALLRRQTSKDTEKDKASLEATHCIVDEGLDEELESNVSDSDSSYSD
jgi:hypothetical protein